MFNTDKAPVVSIIVPCYNEQETIGLLLEAIYGQTYPRQKMEVIIADGLSTDHTRDKIIEFHHNHLDLLVTIVDNQKRSIPSGLNEALRASRGEFIVRLDAHSVPFPDYIERCQEALTSGRGENVGGVWEIQAGGSGRIARAIAQAAAHPLGVGDARYRVGGSAQLVDTVPFGAYRRALVDRIGFYDERLLTNEDYEFNVRIRKSGGAVWFDPNIRSIYYARSTLSQLARQYWRYGYWKAKMIQRYPDTIRWRQLLPPLFVLSLFILGLVGIWSPVAGWLLSLVICLYVIVLLAAGMYSALRIKELSLFFGVPFAIATMHISWGSAFLWSMLVRPDRR